MPPNEDWTHNLDMCCNQELKHDLLVYRSTLNHWTRPDGLVKGHENSSALNKNIPRREKKFGLVQGIFKLSGLSDQTIFGLVIVGI